MDEKFPGKNYSRKYKNVRMTAGVRPLGAKAFYLVLCFTGWDCVRNP